MHRFAMTAVTLGSWLLAVGTASGQQGTGELLGRIVDQQRAVLPGVAVIAKNEASGIFRETVSGGDGSFFMSALTPGSYEVTAELAGFKKYQRRGIIIIVGKTISIDVSLEVGGVEENVTVTAESPLVDTTTKQLGGHVTAQELNDVPSINRNFTTYLAGLPGVSASIATDSFGADSIRINGQNVRNVNYTFDGAGNNDNFNAGNGGSQARVPVEAVQEFQLLTAQFDAEFGNSAGGVVNAVSKQGTNALRGTVFFFDQNDKMTVRDYFAEKQDLKKPETKQLQWGGNVGGPIVRNKLHYFVNLERIDQNRGRTINIPARPELNFTDFTHDNVWNWMARVDHQINANHTWAVRWLRESSPQTNQYPNLTPTIGTRIRAEQEEDVDWTMVGTLNSVLATTKVNTLKLSYTNEDVFFGNPAYFAAGDQAALSPRLEHRTFQDGPSARANRRMDPAYQLDETFNWFLPGKRGEHDLKFGASYYYLPLRIYDAGNLNGSFIFSTSDRDFDAGDPGTYPDRFTIRVPSAQDYVVKGHTIGVFAQDKWSINSRLTASLGLRYDVEVVPLRETDNFLFSDASNYPIDKNNFSPRVGATWTLDQAGHSVIRGGWGLYYQKTPFSVYTDFVASGVFSDSFTVTFCGPPAAPICPSATTIDPGPSSGRLPTNPFLVNGPVVNRALLNSTFPAGSRQKNTGTVFLDTPDRRLPYSSQATIGYERQFRGNMAISADYVHLNLRDLYLRKDLNPGLRTSTSRTATLVRTNPDFTGSVLQLVNSGWADYNALQLSVNKRFSHGYQFRVAYTRSRSYGNTTSPGNIETISTQVLDQLNLEQGEARTAEDRPHLLSANGAVEVPHTRGLIVSAGISYSSGTPFTLVDSTTDPDRNGSFQEALPAGTYSGAATDSDAITLVNDGGFRGARGPDSFLLNMRFGYRIKLGGNRTLQAHFDVFNVTNRPNFANPTNVTAPFAASDRRLPTFLVLQQVANGGPTRTAQFNVKYTF